MKKYFKIYMVFFVIFFCNLSYSQLTRTLSYDSLDSKEKFYFNNFKNGDVYFKDKRITNVELNYQMALQSLAYKDEKGKTLFLSNLNEIDSVVIIGFNFIPINGKFYEKIAGSVNQMLLLSYLGKFDSNSETLTKEYQSISGNDISNIYLLRMQNQANGVKYIYQYWSYDGKNLNRLNNLKSFEKINPNRQAAFENYIKKQNVKMENISSIVDFYNNIIN